MTLIFHWPQITILTVYAISLYLTISKEGKDMGPYPNAQKFVTVLLSLFLLFVLYYGKFFSGC